MVKEVKHIKTQNAIQKPKYRTGQFVTALVFLVIVAILIFIIGVCFFEAVSLFGSMSEEKLDEAPLPGAAALLGVFGGFSFMFVASLLVVPILAFSVTGFLLSLTSANHLPSKTMKIIAIITCSLHGVVMNIFIIGQSLSLFAGRIIMEILNL
jgi:hypothetical protein